MQINYDKLYYEPRAKDAGFFVCCSCEFPLIVEKEDYYYPRSYLRWCANCGRQPTYPVLDRIAAVDGIIDVSQLPGFDVYLNRVLTEKPGNTREIEFLKKQKSERSKMRVEKIGEYVNAEFAEKNPDFVFTSEGEMVADNFNEGRKKWQAMVHAGDETRIYSPNTTTYNWLIDEYGEDTTKWMKKRLRWIVVMREDRKNKEMKKAVYIEGMDIPEI